MSDGSETAMTAAEFRTALGELLAEAQRNDVDPRGSWVYRDREEPLASWEVEIYELQ